MLRDPIYTYECYKCITVGNFLSANEFFCDFELTSAKKKETHGVKLVVEEY